MEWSDSGAQFVSTKLKCTCSFKAVSLIHSFPNLFNNIYPEFSMPPVPFLNKGENSASDI